MYHKIYHFVCVFHSFLRFYVKLFCGRARPYSSSFASHSHGAPLQKGAALESRLLLLAPLASTERVSSLTAVAHRRECVCLPHLKRKRDTSASKTCPRPTVKRTRSSLLGAQGKDEGNSFSLSLLHFCSRSPVLYRHFVFLFFLSSLFS